MLVIRMLTELGRNSNELSENFNKELENIKIDKKHKKEPVRTAEYNK